MESDRPYSKDYIELQTKDKVKFYKTPDSILQKQLEIYDKIEEKNSGKNPLFKEIVESQRKFAERTVKWKKDTYVEPDAWPTTTTSAQAGRAEEGLTRPDGRRSRRKRMVFLQPYQPSGQRARVSRFCKRCEYAEIAASVDKMSTFVGPDTSPGSSSSLTFLISWEVFSRYALDAPHAWAFDVMIMMYGMLFMMAGAYTLSKNGQVRGDVLYGFFPPRLQAGARPDPLLRVFPPRRDRAHLGRLHLRRRILGDQGALGDHRQGPAHLSLQDNHPARRLVLLLQGIVEIIRCVICLKRGRVALARRGCRGGRRRKTQGTWCTSRTRTSPSSTGSS